jgi:subtilase family serine protease
MRGGKHAANIQDPQIPVALAPVVGGIMGLSKIPAISHHTAPHQTAYDEQTHSWRPADTSDINGAAPEYANGSHVYAVTPQDFYTIYDVNPVFTNSELAANATVAVIEESDIEYGTVNGSTHAATGGDVSTFRLLFGVPGTLNMHVYHGSGKVTCSDPGIDPENIGEDIEASLDAEWINTTAPSANLIFMSCDQSPDNGIFSSMAALIDNSLADVMSLSYGDTEIGYTAGNYAFQDALYAQAATQGQSVFISSGDSGSDVADQNTTGTATSGINVNAFASPMVTVTGGTDFSDRYDALSGGVAESTYWGSSNTVYYGDALSYIPETAWNGSCASSILTVLKGYTGAGYCAYNGNNSDGDVVGGSGGFSTHYPVPAWQTGISGYAGAYHSQPDIAGFAANGSWGHYLIFCDTHQGYTCLTSSTFGGAGGTSFVAPYMAGVAGLLVDYTGSRQGLLNPALYALGKAQYTAPATATACYSNGQTSNTGVTTGLPAAACIFNDVTTSNNDVPCAAGSTNCYVNTSAAYGMLSLNGSSSLSVAYPSAPGFDQVTGIGTVKVNNLLTNWNSVFTTTTGLTVTLTSINPAESTSLTATVTGGTPTGFTGLAPTLSGIASFAAGSTALGSCTLSAGSCSVSVSGAALPLQSGGNSVTASFTGSNAYPSSTSSIVTVTVGGGSTSQTITFSPLPNVTYGANPITLGATASSGLTVSYAVTGPATLSGSTLTITGMGQVTVTASQVGSGTYAAATPVAQSFTVAPAVLTVTAANASRAYGAANPTFTYSITGYVNGDSSAVVSGTATEFTTATATSAAGTYPITFLNKALTAANYTFTYVNGTLTINAPLFTLSATPVSIAPGASSGNISTITVTPSGGFTGNVTLAAAITSSPTGSVDAPTFDFRSSSPVNITGTDSGTAAVTVLTTAPATSAQVYPARAGVRWLPAGAALACILLFGIPARRRRWQSMLGMLLLLVALGSSVFACGGGSSTGTTTTQINPTRTTPTVTVTPSASTVTTAQAFTVTVAVSGGTGGATPTGSVTLANGSNTSAAQTLSNGSVTVNVPAGSLAVGSYTFSAVYTPDSASSSTYNSASGSGSVTVTVPPDPGTTPGPYTVTVTGTSGTITATTTFTLTVQ